MTRLVNKNLKFRINIDDKEYLFNDILSVYSYKRFYDEILGLILEKLDSIKIFFSGKEDFLSFYNNIEKIKKSNNVSSKNILNIIKSKNLLSRFEKLKYGFEQHVKLIDKYHFPINFIINESNVYIDMEKTKTDNISNDIDTLLQDIDAMEDEKTLARSIIPTDKTDLDLFDRSVKEPQQVTLMDEGELNSLEKYELPCPYREKNITANTHINPNNTIGSDISTIIKNAIVEKPKAQEILKNVKRGNIEVKTYKDTIKHRHNHQNSDIFVIDTVKSILENDFTIKDMTNYIEKNIGHNNTDSINILDKTIHHISKIKKIIDIIKE